MVKDSRGRKSLKSTTGWWFGTFFIFPYIGNFIISTDFHSIIFQRGWFNHQADSHCGRKSLKSTMGKSGPNGAPLINHDLRCWFSGPSFSRDLTASVWLRSAMQRVSCQLESAESTRPGKVTGHYGKIHNF